ncbi:MAG: signal peptide peptidase SppA [Candidatus Delongbacteria bacterium]
MGTIRNAVKWFFKTTITVIIVFAVLLFFMLAFVAKLSFDNIKPKSVSMDSYIQLSFPYGLTESPSDLIDMSGFRITDINKKTLTLGDVLQKLSAASKDLRIKGILIDIDKWNLTYEHTNEIISSLKQLEDKHIIAYGSSLSNVSYLAALSADEIIIDPSNSSTIILHGLSASVPYFKKLGDKLGIDVEVIHIGQFKGAGENFTRDNMTDEYRSSIEKVINSRIDNFSETVSVYRKQDKTGLTERILNGEMVFITPRQALDMKLIDKLMSYEEIVAENLIGDKQIISISDYEINGVEKDNEDRIAVIYAEGNIVDSGQGSSFSENTIYPESFGRILKKIRKDDKIKAVVLRINSPGGSALASEKILRQIISLKKDIPVIVSMGSTAASGGYYIACHGTKIFADQYTITGSIGVVSMIPNFKNMLDKLGINYQKVSKGKYSDIFDFSKERSSDDTELMRMSMLRIYDEFKSRVSEGRNISLEDLELIAQGQIWTGEQAKANGLVDEIGGLEDAIEEAARISALENYGIVSFPENKTFSEKIFDIDTDDASLYSMFKNTGLLEKELQILRTVLIFEGKPSLIMPVIME